MYLYTLSCTITEVEDTSIWKKVMSAKLFPFLDKELVWYSGLWSRTHFGYIHVKYQNSF